MLDVYPFDSIESYTLFDDDEEDGFFMDLFNEDLSVSSRSSSEGSE